MLYGLGNSAKGRQESFCRAVAMIDKDVELALIRAAGGGDHRAFERLVRTYQNSMFNFINRYLGDQCAAAYRF